ncbi:C2H2 type zinc-finger-domain-containing protein [Boeremia exigua]|uniref:C2H2 type zinc-finger-domain-containing protein n=1 Tax=Boeremia exigua TaxID=749465 RepID=UPI001E8E179E|nr:C2H2 type zinc-finger-domain-containing protein [Boeremia exigua]KAH6614918.1 C2H2 type zinc-finger-domain-containing protein [Boeremia exigua]
MAVTALGTLSTTNFTTHDVTPTLRADPRLSCICNSCHLSFDTNEAQREHMKSSWHVYNLKRRIVSLPPIPLSVFEGQIQIVEAPIITVSRDDHPKKEEEELDSPFQCLFCHLTFMNDHEEVRDVIEHMSTAHGFFIPDQAMLSDSTSFLGYLRTQVRVWHECLYCGIVRTSTWAIQAHMKDSGHCRLNFEREPELSEFWESSKSTANSTTSVPLQKSRRGVRELKPAYGRMVVSDTSHGARRREERGQAESLLRPEQLEPQALSKRHRCHQLVRLDEQGISNISPQQRHALVVAVKRSQKDAAMSTRAKEWTVARKANKQKHDQSHGPLSWAKGGMHNLLPR